MIATVFPYTLDLKLPFGISGLTRRSTPVVFVMLESEGVFGIGEASLPPYLPETSQTVVDYVRSLDLSSFGIDNEEAVLGMIHFHAGNYAAKAALETAFLDLKGKITDRPVWKMLGLKSTLPKNTYTIGIGDTSQIPEKLDDAAAFDIIKVKLGSDDDKAIVRTIRSLTDKQLCADVNQGWKDLNKAIAMCEWLKEEGFTLVEQPFPKSRINDHEELRKRKILPVYADESVQNKEDLEKHQQAFDGINVKLMKCGGPLRAMELIKKAQAHKMNVLLGSMNESSCANLAAAHIGSMADLTDLDGPFLITNNPFHAPVMENGRIMLTNNPGLGLEYREGFTKFKESFFN